MEIYVASYLNPDVVPLDVYIIIRNSVKIENDNLQWLHWLCTLFYEAMGDLSRCISGDMDYSYDKEDPECKIINMESMVYMVITNAPTDTHDLSKNPPQCVDPDNIKSGVYYFFKKGIFWKLWEVGITYIGHYKVINDKDYNI